MMKSNTTRALIGFVAVSLLAVALLLDLRFRGLAWQFFWYQTGEESIPGQIRGMVELGGNLVRLPPQTEPISPITHAADNFFAINTFLEQEADPAKVEAQLRMISEAGFTLIRQEFPWEDIEVDGRGQFTDSRNDLDGDGQPDTISSWEKYDRIVDLAAQYDIQVLARLSNPPDWTRANNPDTEGGNKAPPDDFTDFVNFAVAVAEHFEGRITHYQIWNEPNIYPEWGEQVANPVEYTQQMLCPTYEALKAVDTDLVIVSGAIAPTISLSGRDYQDLVYLQNMYYAGAADCFDVLAAQGYGLNSGPWDRRYRATYVSIARHQMYRDIMVRNGDAEKSIWLSEVSWNAVADAALPPEAISGYGAFGIATRDQAARYTPLAYQRAREEWPWIGQMGYWFFTRASDAERAQALFYFRMVEPDYSPEKPDFTPLPVYNSMQAYITEARENPVLYRGVHQAESWEINAPEAEMIADENAIFGTARQGRSFTFTSSGTATHVRLQGEEVRISVDGGQIETYQADTFQEITLTRSVSPRAHLISIEAAEAIVFDQVMIENDTLRNGMVASATGMLVFVIAGGLWWVLRRRERASAA